MYVSMLFSLYWFWFFNFSFWSHGNVCRVTIPRPPIKPGPPAVGPWSPNHWTTGEVPWSGHFLPNGEEVVSVRRTQVTQQINYVCVGVW